MAKLGYRMTDEERGLVFENIINEEYCKFVASHPELEGIGKPDKKEYHIDRLEQNNLEPFSPSFPRWEASRYGWAMEIKGRGRFLGFLPSSRTYLSIDHPKSETVYASFPSDLRYNFDNIEANLSRMGLEAGLEPLADSISRRLLEEGVVENISLKKPRIKAKAH